MNKIYTKARAKINLNLLILDKRKDGYHNIKSIFQKINLYDELYIEKNNTDKIEIKTNIKEIPIEKNIIYKAYNKLKEKYKNITGVTVTLNKKIPIQAGLAGGSTDCASFLKAMNKLFKLNISREELKQIGKTLGADVVPCLYNKVVQAEGIGDKITEIKTTTKYYVVIIKSEKLNGNTKEMFKKIDENKKIKQKDNTNEIKKALEESDIIAIKNKTYNTFEKVSDQKEIEKIKQELKTEGAIESLMTGSGACIYGIFENKNKAKKAYKTLKNKYETYICSTHNSKK